MKLKIKNAIRQNSLHAFTLVEILIVMAIIAVLLAIAAYGISLVQRNSRNTQRAEFANMLKVGIETYYTNFGRYPRVDQGEICEGTENNIVFKTTTRIVHEFKYKNPILLPTNTTSRVESSYCYATSGTGLYSIQYLNEANVNQTNWSRNIGTWDTACQGTVLDLPNC
jgi:prepilin-type N-terminal cleavage/methylation domain-containing protein